jgi:arylformamidase
LRTSVEGAHFVASAAPALTVQIAGRRWSVAGAGHDLSIPLAFDAAQPVFFGAPPASSAAIEAGSFVGDVQRGGSCNCSTYTLTPHSNGTHTECVGHITRERLSVRELASEHLSAALLVSVEPVPSQRTSEISDPAPLPGDRLITRAALAAAVGQHDLSHYRALVVRTLPNDEAKLRRNYDVGEPAPYFSADAMCWIVARGVTTLVVDLPSIDRANDQGRLTTHRIFWGLPAGGKAAAQATRRNATLTELAFIDDSIADGPYLLNLQVAPFVADAAPSRPILLPLTPL